MDPDAPDREKISHRRRLQRLLQSLRSEETAHLLSTVLSAACFAAIAYTLTFSHPQALAGLAPAPVAAAAPLAATILALVQAYKGPGRLRRIVWRCELARDERALLHEHPRREELLEDEDLMRLCWKASLLSRRHPATTRNMAGFLEAYNQLLQQYPRLAASGQSRTYIHRMIHQANKGLEIDDTAAKDR